MNEKKVISQKHASEIVQDSSANVQMIGKDGLLDHLESVAPNRIVRYKNASPKHVSRVKSHTFHYYTFSKNFNTFRFEKCKFHNCIFENIWGFFLDLKKCEFIKCEFRNSRFSHSDPGWNELTFRDCYFRNVEMDEGYIANAIFERCFIVGLDLIGEELFNVHFLDSHIENSQFQSVVYYPSDYDINEEMAQDVVFSSCEIQFCYFATSDFRNSTFFETSLYLCAFIDCILSDETIISGEKELQPNYASLDFQTILKSELTNEDILKKYFNIEQPDIRKRVSDISSRMSFQKVFISYSFKDQEFAHALNKIMIKHGIKTFLWEKDAPGGTYLEDVMSKNIREHDRVLFIASEHSIKSKACQFELSEGRKKQEETWDIVFFPIHIDNYLFEVRKSRIRPIDMTTEYWNNIEELKRINSTDFSEFASSDMGMDNNFEQAVINKIIKLIATNIEK